MIITQTIRVAALTLLLLISGNSIAQDSYLCISELSIGFEYNKSTGKYHKINYPEGKSILKKTNKLVNGGTTAAQHWGWFIFGSDDALIAVGQGVADDGLLFLKGLINIRFNMNTLRYDSATYGGHPFDGDLAKAAGYNIEIGNCSKI